jgi:hypothetical protein
MCHPAYDLPDETIDDLRTPGHGARGAAGGPPRAAWPTSAILAAHLAYRQQTKAATKGSAVMKSTIRSRGSPSFEQTPGELLTAAWAEYVEHHKDHFAADLQRAADLCCATARWMISSSSRTSLITRWSRSPSMT